MPACLVFHEGNALALVSLGNNSSWLALACTCCVKCSKDFFKIVTVNYNYVEAECFELFVNWLNGDNVIVVAVSQGQPLPRTYHRT